MTLHLSQFPFTPPGVKPIGQGATCEVIWIREGTDYNTSVIAATSRRFDPNNFYAINHAIRLYVASVLNESAFGNLAEYIRVLLTAQGLIY